MIGLNSESRKPAFIRKLLEDAHLLRQKKRDPGKGVLS